MNAKKIFILVEGDDDEDFINAIFRPIIENKDYTLKVLKYAQKTHENTQKKIQSIQDMGGICLLLRDLDNEPCILKKKRKLKKKLCPNWICCIFVIVARVIEGWYLAGLVLDSCRSNKLNWRPCSTEGVTKEQFNSIIPQRMTRYEFKQLILEKYNLQQGLGYNDSLSYFSDKLLSVI